MNRKKEKLLQDAQYDATAKNILGHKSMLAYILSKTIDEFKGIPYKEVLPYIEGEPYISKVTVEPGYTNCMKDRNGRKV